MPVKQVKFEPAQFTIVSIKQQINKESILIVKINDNNVSDKSERLKPRQIISEFNINRPIENSKDHLKTALYRSVLRIYFSEPLYAT
jgi:hypothetical protein